MKSILIIIILAVIVYGCNNGSKEKSLQQTHNFDYTYTIPKDRGTLYYPLDSLSFAPNGKNRGSDSFIKSIYSEILFNLSEPVLYNYRGSGEVLRLLWMRAFDNPVVLRVNKLQDSVYMTVRELGKEFYNRDNFLYKKMIDTAFMLRANEWEDILRGASTNFFWLSSYDTLDDDDDYKDVTMWVLEYSLEGKYHCINRLYFDTLSLKPYPATKKMYEIAKSIVPMKNSRE